METIDIQPASIPQVRAATSGRLVEVEGDVARDLQQLDPGLRLRYSPDEDISIVWMVEGGRSSSSPPSGASRTTGSSRS
jgi:hypothetical protein